jgi:hypothetical protein
VTYGTAIAVTASAPATVNFALVSGGAINGKVKGPGVGLLSGVTLTLYRS